MSRVRKAVPKPSQGNQVLVIGMDLDMGTKQTYRPRGALFPADDWISENEEVPKSVKAIWIHKSLEVQFKRKFATDLKQYDESNVRFSTSIPSLRQFLDIQLPPPATEIQPQLLEQSRSDLLSELRAELDTTKCQLLLAERAKITAESQFNAIMLVNESLKARLTCALKDAARYLKLLQEHRVKFADEEDMERTPAPAAKRFASR
jgi:hypothetical protein